MATSTDLTAFRIISTDGMLDHESASSDGHTLKSFEDYGSELEEGQIAQWFVVRTGDLLAEYVYGRGTLTYPAADLFIL